MSRYIALLLLLSAAVHAASAIIDGLLANGNFEAGPKPNQLNGTVVLARDAIPSWRVSGLVEYIRSGQKQGDMILPVPEGACAVRLGNEASISQCFAVETGMRYSITFNAARTCAQDERLNVTVTPESGVLPIQTMYSSSGWDSHAWAFLAKFDWVCLVIRNPGVEDDPACGPLIDSIAMSALNHPRPTRRNKLRNGDFEEGPYFLPESTYGVLIPPNIEDDHSPLPGWIVESLKAVKYVDSQHFSVPRGKRAVELVAGKEGALAQIVRTTPGRTYALAFSVGDAANSCVGSMTVEAYAGRGAAKVPYQSKGTGGSKRAVLKFAAVSTRTRVVFLSAFYHMKTDGSLCGPVVDDVSLVGVRRTGHM